MAVNATEQVIENEKKRAGIFGFFSKFLSDDKKIVLKENEDHNNDVIGKNEPTISQNVLDTITQYITASNMNTGTQYNGSATSIHNFAPLFNSKKAKVIAYKAMYQYPEINRSTGIVINEALARDVDGEIVKLIIRQVGDKDVPMAVQEIMNSAFNILCHDIYDIERNLHNWFKRYLIEGEIYIELIYDDTKQTIVGVNVLPSYSMAPVFQENTNNIIGYTQFEDVIINGIQMESDHNEYDSVMGESHKTYLNNNVYGVYGNDNQNIGPIEFISNQIAYANSGSYSTSVYDVDGYYAPIRKTFNQLSTVDDALAIYRFVRAPETRLWNIYTGNLPPSKVDNYVENVITEFRKDFNYDPSTGAIMQDTMFASIVDDFFFAQDGNGNKTSVETLSGAMNLDQLSDVMYYKEKLYAGLHIPKSYWDPASETVINSSRDSVKHDEMELTYFVEQLQNNFVDIFTGPFETLLRIMGVDEKWINKKYYSIKFSKRNSWQFWQDNARMTAQATLYAAMLPFVYNPTENPNGQYAPKFVFDKCFQLSANDEQINADMLEEYKNSLKPDYKTPDQEWKQGVPEYDGDFKYDQGYEYTDRVNTVELGDFQYGKEPKYNYGAKQSSKELAKLGIDEVDMGDYDFDVGEYLYGHSRENDYEPSTSSDVSTSIGEFVYGEDLFDYSDRGYKYGIENELLEKDESNFLDSVEFEILGVPGLSDGVPLTPEEVYSFGDTFTYDKTGYSYDFNDTSLDKLVEYSPEYYSFENEYNYGTEKNIDDYNYES